MNAPSHPRTDMLKSLLLLGMAFVAFGLENGPWADSISSFWHHAWFQKTHWLLEHVSPRSIVNEGAMTLFFLMIGAELKRESTDGELYPIQKAWAPILAAIGGILMPAVIYLLFAHKPVFAKGWAIPSATDIVFTMGILSALSHRVPGWLRVFFLVLSVADDMGAVLILALFYGKPLSALGLIASAIVIAVLVLLALRRVQYVALYLAAGALLWLAFTYAGIHPTLAGVAVGLSLPMHAAHTNRRPPLKHVQTTLENWVSYLVLPLFVLANAGFPLRSLSVAMLLHPLFLGITLGLAIGKPMGILLVTWLLRRSKKILITSAFAWRPFIGASCLGGVGFTMSLFVAQIAFPVGPAQSLAKAAIFCGSIASALLGSLLLLWLAPQRAEQPIAEVKKSKDGQ